jgi:membrane-bound metal-dependent hydrolase YbcI (DUF457 family)
VLVWAGSEPGRHNAGAVFDSATFGIGMTIGLVSHIVLDMLYMKGRVTRGMFDGGIVFVKYSFRMSCDPLIH